MSINLHLGDCLEAMRDMPDNSYELAIVDPPYGIGAGGVKFKNRTTKRKKNYYKEKDWDSSIPSKQYFKELQRVSKNQIIWGGNYFCDFLGAFRSFIFWDKTIYGNSYSDGELAWTSFDKVARCYRKNISQVTREGRIHPTQKPVKLYEWLLDNYAQEGSRILDTHLGSGSIAIACHNRGYSLDAYEIDEEYYNAATERLRVYQRQLTIF